MLPQIHKILYATDLSDPAKHALSYALSIAKQYQADLMLLHVIPDWARNISLSSGLDFATIYNEDAWLKIKDDVLRVSMKHAKERIESTYKNYKQELEAAGIATSVHVQTGHPVKTILQFANQADLIVMGTYGHSKLGSIFAGSVAQGVISKSTKPVLVVHLEKDGTEAPL
ncbi:universal stress protein [Halodesulfovibrio marinisediminis]|uniref:Nucleotide-binding universal stress protein, UspA family n=1 Tax=Halodesulfovibrio marinisediminis DSM 17456 TaxID=1121457 RepID=A0A1N6DCX6_9BACT|nr:universal stress protein [Halodesulfovibrio marinisediminis]SIN68678.1 Nucleotide-binding universal stress protein, UspA family [Halodesulfovibrio marinisediminis DSM 17456]